MCVNGGSSSSVSTRSDCSSSDSSWHVGDGSSVSGWNGGRWGSHTGSYGYYPCNGAGRRNQGWRNQGWETGSRWGASEDWGTWQDRRRRWAPLILRQVRGGGEAVDKEERDDKRDDDPEEIE